MPSFCNLWSCVTHRLHTTKTFLTHTNSNMLNKLLYRNITKTSLKIEIFELWSDSKTQKIWWKTSKTLHPRHIYYFPSAVLAHLMLNFVTHSHSVAVYHFLQIEGEDWTIVVILKESFLFWSALWNLLIVELDHPSPSSSLIIEPPTNDSKLWHP